MPIAPRGERGLRVVEVQAPEVLEPEHAVPLLPDGIECAAQVVPRRVEVAGIGAESDPVAEVRRNPVAQSGKLLEATAERGARACSSLKEHPDLSGNRLQTVHESGRVPVEPAL